MQLQYYRYFLQSHEYSIWPFDLGLTYIFSLNLSNILQSLLVCEKHKRQVKKLISPSENERMYHKIWIYYHVNFLQLH